MSEKYANERKKRTSAFPARIIRYIHCNFRLAVFILPLGCPFRINYRVVRQTAAAIRERKSKRVKKAKRHGSRRRTKCLIPLIKHLVARARACVGYISRSWSKLDSHALFRCRGKPTIYICAMRDSPRRRLDRRDIGSPSLLNSVDACVRAPSACTYIYMIHTLAGNIAPLSIPFYF